MHRAAAKKVRHYRSARCIADDLSERGSDGTDMSMGLSTVATRRWWVAVARSGPVSTKLANLRDARLSPGHLDKNVRLQRFDRRTRPDAWQQAVNRQQLTSGELRERGFQSFGVALKRQRG